MAPHRLYLGCRIAWGRDVVYEECARYADVVSVNAYGYPPMRDLPPTDDLAVWRGAFTSVAAASLSYGFWPETPERTASGLPRTSVVW